jgi:hypoxanthine phosphoribosyltransferase
LDWAGVFALAAFFVAGTLRLRLVSEDPEEIWRKSQDVADAAESLAWRYAVGGAPLSLTERGGSVDTQLLSRLNDLSLSLHDTEVVPSKAHNVQITPRMRDLRKAPWSERKDAYKSGRLQSLHLQYAAAADRSRRRARAWSRVLLVAEVAGVLGAIFKAAHITPIDTLGVTGAFVAGGTAWVQTKQYRIRAAAFGAPMAELTTAMELVGTVESEWSWAEFVQRVEDQIVLGGKPVASALSIRTGASLSILQLQKRVMTWEQYYRAVEQLYQEVRRDPRRGKFDPDVVVAVNPGGAIVGALLYFMTRAFSFVPISHRSPTGASAETAIRELRNVQPKVQGRLRMLVVDASFKSGQALGKTLELIEANLEPDMIDVRTAVLVYRPIQEYAEGARWPARPDYFVDTTFDAFPYGDI